MCFRYIRYHNATNVIRMLVTSKIPFKDTVSGLIRVRSDLRPEITFPPPPWYPFPSSLIVLMTSKYSYGTAVFDVDLQTGFMPPSEPLLRLPVRWEPWEATLEAAIRGQLQLGDKPGLTEEEEAQSEQWRASVRLVSLLVLLPFHKTLTRIGCVVASDRYRGPCIRRHS